MKPGITILTTVYNGLPYLSECIESILNQTEADFEFLIIDDASTDRSLEIIKSYKDPRIKVVENEENIGQVRSLNRGLKIAKGNLIARLDQDDVCLPNRLEEQADYFEKYSDLSILCSWEITIDSNGKKVRSWEGEIKNYGVFLGYIILGLCPVWHPSVMFRKDAVVELGGYDDSYGAASDYELWKRMAVKRLNAAIVPRYHLLQRVHDRRQSVLQIDTQTDYAQKAHNEVVAGFCENENSECLAALLRLGSDPCGSSYRQEHIKDLAVKLDKMFENIDNKQGLSATESKYIKKAVYGRVGLGVRFAAQLTRLPKILFYPAFYLLSPLVLPNIRAVLSRINYAIHKMRYAFKV